MFDTAYSEVVDKAFAHLHAKANYSSTCTWAEVFEDQRVDYRINHVCFGALRYRRSSYKNNTLRYLVCWTNQRYKDKPITPQDRSYIKYLANNSLWADAYITKDPEEIIRKGAVMDTNYPSQYVVQAMIGSRSISEKPYQIRAWNRLIKYVDKDLAFAMMGYFYFGLDGTWRLHGGGCEHDMFSQPANEEGYASILLKDKSRFKLFTPFSQVTNFRNLCSIWQGTTRSTPFIYRSKENHISTYKNTLGIPFKSNLNNSKMFPRYMSEFFDSNVPSPAQVARGVTSWRK